MWKITRNFQKSKNLFLAVTPGLEALVTLKAVRAALQINGTFWTIWNAKKEDDSVSNIVASLLASRVKGMAYGKISNHVNNAFKLAAFERMPAFQTKTWISIKNDADQNGRIIKDLVIIYHDANKAGKHLDIHIGHLSLVMRITGKPVEDKLKFVNGRLTEASRDALLDHVRAEINNNSRVAQNLDHSKSEARNSWMYDESLKEVEGYGSGATRQIVMEEKIEIYKTGGENDNLLEMYIPTLFPYHGLYLYKIYSGETTGTPITIFGKMKNSAPKVQDRLHLKMIKDIDKYRELVDPNTNTIKYDGASTYLDIKEKSSKFYSPRISKVTGERIEYTFKLPELARMKDPLGNSIGMGELLFYRKNIFGQRKYLSAAQIGGVLNSNSIRPEDIFPEIVLYRLDKYHGMDVTGTDFFENREMVSFLSSLSSFIIPPKVVDIRQVKNIEGFVGVGKGDSIVNGYKFKFVEDPEDWVLETINFKLTSTGHVSGICTFRFEDKVFNMGPGQIGDRSSCIDMMNNPKNYIGTTAKVVSRRGFTGRAAKMEGWHLDK